MATHQLVLTPILDFFLLLEIATMWQTDSTAYKLKPKSFYKSAHLQAYLADFYLWYELCLTTLYNTVDKETKKFNLVPNFLCKSSWDFNSKNEYDTIVNS